MVRVAEHEIDEGVFCTRVGNCVVNSGRLREICVDFFGIFEIGMDRLCGVSHCKDDFGVLA